ncbi:hypothetical protein DFP72DRAFT_1099271 [Ephemerocybe angulata]|uniref:Uncharacterized protein n=1 Tax=Ephemerocybe angulata TaxID=980116 RepID=A0A8H6I8S7_9AGAR|nr:hypothetical protein DFP72DRAFT_1099271 [Tulosesus angulatus]
MDPTHKSNGVKGWLRKHLRVSRSPPPPPLTSSLSRAARPPLGVIFSTAGIPDPLIEGQNVDGGPAVPPISVGRKTGPTVERPVHVPSTTTNPSSPDPGHPTQTNQNTGDPTEESLEGGYKPQSLRNKVYEGVKSTLRAVVARYIENPKEFEKLLLRVDLLAKTIKSCPSSALFKSLESRFEKMSKDLEIIKRKVEEKMPKDRWRISRVFLSEQDTRELSELTSQIAHLIEETMFEVTIKNGSWTLQIVSEIDWMQGQLNSMFLAYSLRLPKAHSNTQLLRTR